MLTVMGLGIAHLHYSVSFSQFLLYLDFLPQYQNAKDGQMFGVLVDRTICLC